MCDNKFLSYNRSWQRTFISVNNSFLVRVRAHACNNVFLYAGTFAV
eukprot:UN18301